MNPESWGFIGTLVGAIVGASVSIFTTRINNTNAIRIQNTIEKHARKERQRDFQRNNLLELQEKLSSGMRLVSRAYLEDLENFKKTQTWKSSYLSADLNESIAACFRELSIKSERVANDDLRIEIINIKRLMADILLERNHETAEGKLFQLTDNFELVMPKLGKILRENY